MDTADATRGLLNNRELVGSSLYVRNDDPEANRERFLRFLGLLLLLLGMTEYVFGIMVHSPMLSIQFAGSVLAVASALELTHYPNVRYLQSHQAINLLFRTFGTIFYIACMFLNLTHCLEDISDIKSSEHSHDVNETENSAHSHGPDLAVNVFYITIADVIVKSVFTLVYNPLSIHFIGNFVVLVSPPAIAIALYFYNKLELHFFFDWLDHHLEPVTAIALTLICIVIAVFSLHRKKQYLLAEGPKNFKIDEISESVKTKNSSLDKVDHVHASCVWPDGFTVSLKAYIKVEKNNKNWVAQAADDFLNLKSLLHTEIKAKGAKDVIVEPVFVDQNELNPASDPICISTSCHNEDVGCCTIPKTADKA
ncbi:Protein CBR-SUR-7 [Caenorhabditis briggsae]|uniref:Protein CBR-SUR-7 n=3 Tax=Caenorhabditis briggsae TaxID=6238 RepID=A8XNK8_CAEBR|nr:Protein CBR-SUR-7 [Caenorhabditis briggsae]ULT79694.1 hypothetical protein L3Y34_010340 [Caenorhabditis briggsae]CAP34097.2 Protein CBR-SUR-7 [Caenorhabditis briggsae]